MQPKINNPSSSIICSNCLPADEQQMNNQLDQHRIVYIDTDSYTGTFLHNWNCAAQAETIIGI